MYSSLRFTCLFCAYLSLASAAFGQIEQSSVFVRIENIAPNDGVAITPVWVGFHSGSFDSYNGGTLALEGLERIAEDGNSGLLSAQFNDFDPKNGGYTYIDNSGDVGQSALVRTGDLTDAFRQDATMGNGPLLPGDVATEEFILRNDGSNNYFSYVSMILPSNDFFTANGNPLAHSIGSILQNGGEISFVIGTPNGGVNDAGTEFESFEFSAGNGLFPGRSLPMGQSGPNVGATTSELIANVVGNPFELFELKSSEGVADLAGLDFNQYEAGIATVTIGANITSGDLNGDGMVDLTDVSPFVDALASGEYSVAADVNLDGQVNLLDVGPLVELLGG